MAAVCHPDYLYVSHLHGDHCDAAFLRDSVDNSTTVLLPDFPTDELQRALTRLGFRNFTRTRYGEEGELLHGLRVAIQVESSITDGPGGGSVFLAKSRFTAFRFVQDLSIVKMEVVESASPQRELESQQMLDSLVGLRASLL